MPELEPITREEKFLNGEVGMTPITREEKILAGEDIETVTRREYFLKKYRGGGGGDVTVVPLSVTDNGTYSEEGKAYSPVSVNVPLPQNAYLLKSVANLPQAIASFNDGEDMVMPTLKVAIEPQQDLHGYDSPWAGGAGKNKLPMTVDGIKAVNTYHSWSGNSTTINNVTITIETNNSGDVTGIKFNGTASADITFNLATNISISNGEYKWSNDQIVNVSNLWLSLTNPNIAITLNAEKEKNVTVSNGSIGSAYIYATSGNTFNNVVFKPMIRLASVSDSTFEPYSNICPISGWDEADVTKCGKNLWGGEKLADDIVSKVPQATKDTANKTVTYYASQVTGITLFNKFKENTRYTFYFSTSSSYTNMMVRYTDGTYDGIEPNTYKVTNANKTVSEIRGSWASGTTVLKYEECGIFEGVLTAEDFVPYNGQVYTIDLDGTRYGGVLDVVSGVLTVDRKYISLNGEWSQAGNGAFYVDNKATDGKEGAENTQANVISNLYPNGYVGGSTNIAIDKPKTLCTQNLNGLRFIVYDTTWGSVADFNNYLAQNPLQLVYELATPQTIQLTPTQVKSLLGQNNIWADTGNIKDAEYFSKEV